MKKKHTNIESRWQWGVLPDPRRGFVLLGDMFGLFCVLRGVDGPKCPPVKVGGFEGVALSLICGPLMPRKDGPRYTQISSAPMTKQ